MKIRSSFVSNSSSCSFVLDKKQLSSDQIDVIFNMGKFVIDELAWHKFSIEDGVSKEHFEESYRYLSEMEKEFSLGQDENYVVGDTSMCNSEIGDLFKLIGIKKESILLFYHSNGDIWLRVYERENGSSKYDLAMTRYVCEHFDKNLNWSKQVRPEAERISLEAAKTYLKKNEYNMPNKDETFALISLVLSQ